MLFKTDFSAYYKQLSIDPGDLPTLAFAYAGKIYFEARLPFGLRSSCLNAQRVTRALILIYNHQTKSFLAGYIDDCLGVSLPSEASSNYVTLINLSGELGLGLTLPKCVPPCYCLVWIGLELDTMDLMIRLPCEKRDRIILFLEQWLQKKSASKGELQSLLGVLNHAASAVICGRAFTGYVIDLLREESFPVPLTDELYKDVELWLRFLQSDMANGMRMKSPKHIPPDFLLEVAYTSNRVAIRVQDVTEVFVIEDDLSESPRMLCIYAFWLAAQYASHRFPGVWLTCSVPTSADVMTVNRARNVIKSLRPMVRHTWALQAKFDMAIRARKCDSKRDICNTVRDTFDGEIVSCNQVPEIFM